MDWQKTSATIKIANLSKRIRAVQGGTSASKTISIILWLIHLAQLDKKKTLTSIISESFPHLKRGAMRDFLMIMEDQSYFQPSRWNRGDYQYTFETGSVIEFFSADQPGKMRGARRDRLFINEANNVPFKAFEELEVRTKEIIFLDWNPVSEFWFYDKVLEQRNDVEHIVLNYKDNEALDQQIIDSIEQRKNRPGWWLVYGLGQLGEVEGKIYKGWKLNVEGVPHEAKLLRYCMDFGYSADHSAIVGIHYLNGGLILDEILFKKGQSNKNLADVILNQPEGETCLTIADSAEPKSIDEIKSYGVNIIGAEKGRDSVANGIQIVQDQKISVTKRSTNINKGYRNYLWEVDPKTGKILNKPEHMWSDAMDAIRYGITSIKKPEKKGIHVFRPRQQVSTADVMHDLQRTGVKIIRPSRSGFNKRFGR